MAEGTSFGGLEDTRITESTVDLTQQLLGVDKKVEELGIKLDKMDFKLEEVKQLIMGLQNQESTVVKLKSDETSEEDTGSKSTCMEEVNFN